MTVGINKTDDAPIRRDLNCVSCGYNLRGLRPSGECPECGEDITESIREGPQPVRDEWRIHTSLAIRLEIWIAALTVGCCAFGGLLGLLNHAGLSQPQPSRTESESRAILRKTVAWMPYWLPLLLVFLMALAMNLGYRDSYMLVTTLVFVSAVRFGVVYAYIAELGDEYRAPDAAWKLRGAAVLQAVSQALLGYVSLASLGGWAWLVVLPLGATVALSVMGLTAIANKIEPPEPDPNAPPKMPPLNME